MALPWKQIIFLKAFFPLLLVSAQSLQYMGRAISFDWHFRSHKFPPLRETLDLESADGGAPSSGKLHYEFVAFGKQWTMDMMKNNILYTSKSQVTERNVKGRVLKTHRVESDCYYIGTAKGGDSEYGMASLSLCGQEVNGLLVTNINDYVIYDTSWKSKRQKRLIHEQKLNLRIANTTEYENHVKDSRLYEKVMDAVNATKYRQKREADDVQTPKFYKLDPPAGRNFFIELGIIVDQYYMNDFNSQVSRSTSDLFRHILLSFNNAQLWYIHPTLGFNIWFVITDIVMIGEDLPLSRNTHTLSNPSSICKWVKKSFTDNATWDEVLILSSKPNIWHGRVGLAQRAGVCSHYGNDRCAGVSHVNFQMASLARLIAHEAMHPLGVGDDYEGRTAALCYSGVMRRGVWQDHDWSVCAVQGFERWAGAKISDCITRHNTPTLAERTTPPLLPVNIAWRANVIQSTTYKSEKEWGAWKATDGPLTGVPGNGDARYGSCTHTLRQDKPWIRVDLDEEYSTKPIESIIVYNRDDCCENRLKNFEVRIGRQANFRANSLCFHYKQVVPGGRNGAAVITCSRPMTGSHVSVQLMDRNSILTVCEIQIMAKVVQKDFSYTQNKCHDIDGFCAYWKDMGECTRRGQQSYMEEHCPYSCGVCKRPDKRPANHNAPYDDVIHPVSAPPKDSCRDTHDSCLHYAANGDCDIDLDMQRRCPWSCNVCAPTTTSVSTRYISTTTSSTTVTTSRTTTHRLKPQKNEHKTMDKKNEVRVTPPAFNRETTTTKATHGIVGEKPASTQSAKLSDEEVVTKQYSTYASTTATAADSDCADAKKSCKAWMKMGYCASSNVVRNLCQKSCDLCPTLGTTVTTAGNTLDSIGTVIVSTRGNKAETLGHTAAVKYTTAATTGSTAATTESAAATTETAAATTESTAATTDTAAATTVSAAATTESAAATTETAAATTETAAATTESTAATTRSAAVSMPEEHVTHADCSDSHPSVCPSWARAGLCEKKSVKKLCPMSCQTCQPTMLKKQTTPNAVDKTQGETTPSDMSCADGRNSCTAWARKGHCRIKSVASRCRFSCKKCPSLASLTTTAPTSCVDNASDSSCRDWSRRGLCSHPHVRSGCKKSCRAC